MRELTEKEWKRIEDVCPYDHEGHANYSIPVRLASVLPS